MAVLPAKRPTPGVAANHAASAVAAERAAAAKAAMQRAEASAKANEPPSPEQREKAAAAAARAAKRLSEGDAPVLTIELLSGGKEDGGKEGGARDKGELLLLMPAGRSGGSEKAEPLEKDTPVSVSMEKGSMVQPLPSTLHKAAGHGHGSGSGGAPAARLTNASGGPVLGHLSVSFPS